jgi:hypothetical protein
MKLNGTKYRNLVANCGVCMPTIVLYIAGMLNCIKFVFTQVFGSFIPYVGGMYVAKASGLSEFKKDYNYDDGQPEVWDFIEGSGNITKASVKLTARMNCVLNAVI